MITATCTNKTCPEYGVSSHVLGEPDRVECGHCCADTDLTDPRPDPESPNNGNQQPE